MRLFPYVGILSPDTRVCKMFLAVWIALTLWLVAVFKGIKIKCKNLFLLIFIGLIMLSANLAPIFVIPLNGVDANGFWIWKPAFRILCFFGMFLCLSNTKFTRKEIECSLKILVYCGVVMSFYIFAQKLGFDQFYYVKTYEEIGQPMNPTLVGTLGNSTIVSAYMAMIIPFALYLKKYISGAVMIVAVVMCNAQVATASMGISLIIYAMMKRHNSIVPISIIIIIVMAFLYLKTDLLVYRQQDNGRFSHWAELYNNVKTQKIGDINKSVYPFTGAGLGSHDIVYSMINKTKFGQAHNDYLEVWYVMGIAGLICFLFSIIYMLYTSVKAWTRFSDWRKTLLAASICSFLCIALNALGSFPFQIGAICYITVFVVAILHNVTFIKGEMQCLRNSQSF